MTSAASPRLVLLVVKGLDLGGIERMVVDLAVDAHRRGEHVAVAVVNQRRDALVGVLVDAAVPVHLLGGGDRVGVRAAWRLRRLCRRPGTVVHAHGPLPAAVVAVFARRTPMVVTFHTLWSALHPVSRALVRVLLPRRAGVLAVSDGVRRSLPAGFGRRATVVGHRVDPRAARAARQRGEVIRRAWATSHPGATLLLMVASHRAVKNHPLLLEAIADVVQRGVDVHLRVVGSGPLLDDHRRLAARLGIADRVHFEAATPHVLDTIAAADALVVPSDAEGQPLVLLEALGVGVPVIATAVGRAPELLADGAGVIVPVGDRGGLADAVLRLATDHAHLDRLRRAAHDAGATAAEDDTLGAHLAAYRAADAAR